MRGPLFQLEPEVNGTPGSFRVLIKQLRKTAYFSNGLVQLPTRKGKEG